MGVAEIVLALIGSSAIFGFIQFLISRRDSRKAMLQDIITKIEDLTKNHSSEFATIRTEIDRVRTDMNANDQSIRDGLEETKAITARVRILRASDEIRHRMKHSKEWFDQLNDDITFYENYCKANPDFRNNKATHAITNINEVYAKALKDDDFL